LGEFKDYEKENPKENQAVQDLSGVWPVGDWDANINGSNGRRWRHTNHPMP